MVLLNASLPSFGMKDPCAERHYPPNRTTTSVVAAAPRTRRSPTRIGTSFFTGCSLSHVPLRLPRATSGQPAEMLADLEVYVK